jgi:hypothetical protein
MMIEVEITDAMINRSRAKAKEMGQLQNSITMGMGNLVGFIGEEVAVHVLKKLHQRHVIHLNTYDYDILVDDIRVDVKTKSTSVAPLPHYSNSVAGFNTSQKCDVYAFVRVKKDLTTAWWCGVIEKDLFFKEAVFMKKGSMDDDNKYVVKADCYNLPISQLRQRI